MKSFESGWESKDGIRFYMRGWEPDKAPKAVVCLLHGHGEHVGRYAHVGEAFSKAGYVLVGYDERGHGKTGGPRGHTPSYDAMMDDVADFLALMEKRYPGLPRFLYGHSMGGNQVINFALRHKPALAGVIATDPWLKLAFDPPAIKVTLGRMMNSIYPAFTQASELETAALSRDPEIVRAYEKDPLVHDKMSARLFVGMYESGLWALDHAAEFPLPLLLMHGTGDRLISSQASREFAERAGRNAAFRAWDGFYHEIHNEPEKAEVLKSMTVWMDERLSKK
ncbi:MAG: lysophospholipase [Chloroflexi bacterium]|nr:lysophospholipase [Chloroflexota bacterium]